MLKNFRIVQQIIFLCFQVGVGADLTEPVCNGIEVPGFCYWAIEKKLTSNDANLKCGEANGTLAEIPNSHINEIISTYLTDNSTFTWIGVQLKKHLAYINMHHVELTFTNFQRAMFYFNEDRINKSHCVALRRKMIADRCTAYRKFVCSFPLQASLCPSSMFAFRQKCFQASDFHLDFWKAEEKCRFGGGHLASVPDLETLELVTSKLSNISLGTTIAIWVGIHFVEENKTYVNMLNEIQNFTEWVQGEPAVSVVVHARDVAIYKAKWYVDFGNRSYPSVCSRRTACQGSELPSNTVKELSNLFPGNFSETLFEFGSELFQYAHGLVISLVCQKTGFWEQFTTKITYCLCPCSRVHVPSYLQKNMSSVVKKMVDIRNQLLLEKSSLSSTRRQKISMADPRRSAFAVGSMLGIGIITSVVLLIVISDLPLLRCQRCLKSKVKP